MRTLPACALISVQLCTHGPFSPATTPRLL